MVNVQMPVSLSNIVTWRSNRTRSTLSLSQEISGNGAPDTIAVNVQESPSRTTHGWIGLVKRGGCPLVLLTTFLITVTSLSVTVLCSSTSRVSLTMSSCWILETSRTSFGGSAFTAGFTVRVHSVTAWPPWFFAMQRKRPWSSGRQSTMTRSILPVWWSYVITKSSLLSMHLWLWNHEISGIGWPVTTQDMVTSRPSVAVIFSRFLVNVGGTVFGSGAGYTKQKQPMKIENIEIIHFFYTIFVSSHM